MVGTSAFVVLVTVLMAVGALAGVAAHFARGHLGFDETPEQHRFGSKAADRFVQKFLFRADLDASGGWDIMSRRNMAGMAIAGAMGPFVAGVAALAMIPH